MFPRKIFLKVRFQKKGNQMTRDMMKNMLTNLCMITMSIKSHSEVSSSIKGLHLMVLKQDMKRVAQLTKPMHEDERRFVIVVEEKNL